jgi:DNA-binding NarL/FixJ family response regulator
MIRILVADDQRLIREGIASLLDIQPDLTVIATASDGNEAVTRALELTPDLILMDVRMPELTGVEATTAVLRQLPTCRILMLTTFDDEEYVIDALRAGASGYLLKDLPADDLAQAIRLAHAGVHQFDPSVTGRLITALTNRTAPVSSEVDSRLTGREIEVLRLIAIGATNREIATRLVVSEGTVKNHVSSILNRLGLRDRTQAAIYAYDHRLL